MIKPVNKLVFVGKIRRFFLWSSRVLILKGSSDKKLANWLFWDDQAQFKNTIFCVADNRALASVDLRINSNSFRYILTPITSNIEYFIVNVSVAQRPDE